MAPSCRSPVASRPTPDLPAEVWLMILNNVERGKDLYSCSQSSRLFNQLLEPDKQYWCFDLLLPLLLPHLQLQDALNCRLICRDWQNSLDTSLQDLNRPCSEDNDRDRHPLAVATSNPDMRKLVTPIRLTHDLVTRAMIINFQRRFEGCRIMGGAVHIGLNRHSGRQPGDYWGSIWIFLRSSFGPRILSVCLNFSAYYFSSPIDMYTLTRVILRECPNLRKLHCIEFLVEIEKVSAMVLESSPLPEMTHLESLALEGTCDEGPEDESLPLIHPLLDKYALQLKWLELSLYPDVTNQTLQKLGNLTELSVLLPDLMQDDAADHARRLLAIPSQHLQRLVLGLGTDIHLFLQTLLDLCDQFPLRCLSVSGNVETRLVGMLGEVRLRRNLKSLIFMDVVGVDSFNFLECFPSLEHLHLRGTYRTMTNPNQDPRNLPKPQYGVRSRTTPETVQIRQFLYPDSEQQMDDMYRSNLWTICPRLKTFVFEYSWVGRRFWLNQNNQQNQFINVDPDENRPRVYTRQGLWRQSGF